MLILVTPFPEVIIQGDLKGFGGQKGAVPILAGHSDTLPRQPASLYLQRFSHAAFYVCLGRQFSYGVI